MPKLVYTGRYVAHGKTKGGKPTNEFVLAHGYRLYHEEPGFDPEPFGGADRFLGWQKPLTPRPVIGGIYEAELVATDSSLAVKGVPKYFKQIRDDALLSEYHAKDQSAESRVLAAKREKDADNRFLASLAFARDTYRKTNHQGKAALLGKLIEYVTR